ncbi:MAG: methyltransferase family protein [Streptosporangiaceae bacterium]
MATLSSLVRADFGKLVMVPAAALMLTLDLTALTHGAGGAGALRQLGTLPVCAFYALVIWCYLRRGPAIATTGSIIARTAAVAATMTPFVIPLLHSTPPGAVRQYAADGLLVAGTAWSACSLRYLGRNLSVFAQARELVDRGPYRWIRHPLYAGEIASSLGIAVAAGTAAAFGIWLAFCVLQAYRVLQEEQVLLRVLPLYRSYRNRTAALIPGLF